MRGVICLIGIISIAQAFDQEKGFEFDKSDESTDSPRVPSTNSTDSLAKCNLNADQGTGDDKLLRYFYNPANKSCGQFEYFGNGGNDNNFGSELDCLSECYSEVNDGTPMKEEDDVMIDSRPTRDVEGCMSPKDSGTGKEEIQKFYYDAKWNNCFAFKYLGQEGNGNRFNSRHECESKCLRMDGSVCKIRPPVEALEIGQDCYNTTCPTGFSCFQGAHSPECCNATVQELSQLMFDPMCPNGERALGEENGEFYHISIGRSCDDLICGSNHECVKVAKDVAKCCATTKNGFKRDAPLDDDVIQVRKKTKPSARFFAVPPPIGRDFCGLAPEHGNCSDHHQKFYFSAEWQSCLVFKYSGCGGNENNFESREECESACLVADGSVCRGPQRPVFPRNNIKKCSKYSCPPGFECYEGLQQIECCNKTVQDVFKSFYSETCPNGQKAEGTSFEGYFSVLVAENCDELDCNDNFECHQLSNHAKCCEKSSKHTILGSMGKSSFGNGIGSKSQGFGIGMTMKAHYVGSGIIPKSQDFGSNYVMRSDVAVIKRSVEICPAIEQRLVKSCNQILTDMEVVRKIWQAPRIISAEGIIQHLNIMCTKFDEYKNCLTMMTSNAACLDPLMSRKEQVLGFICQKVVREAIVSTENQRCLRRISKIEKIRNCEDDLEKGLVNNIFDKYSICSAFDETLQCSAHELLKCGPNTFSLMKNIITTLKANIKQCVNQTESLDKMQSVEDRAEDKNEESEEEDYDSTSSTEATTQVVTTTKKVKIRRDRRCPREHVEKAESCTYLIGFRKIREIFRLQNDFVLSNFDVNNINEYCDHSKSYRKCMELSLSDDERCLHLLSEDPFYSFVVAFEDRLCETEKQLKWLINAGCLSNIAQSPNLGECLKNTDIQDERVLCGVTEQLESCVYGEIKTTCRLQEVQFFTEIMEMLKHRHRFCQPPSNRTVTRSRHDTRAVQFDVKDVTPLPLSRRGCRNSRKIAMFKLNGYIPECDENGNYRFMQCDKGSGSCWCVDIHSGHPIQGTLAPPGRPLPMCGLNYLFTCEKLPDPTFCEADNEKPQKTERWHRQGNRCVQYMHSYCPSTAHLPPMPIRTESACKSFCLPSSG
ncbi:unnamed protein product [Bursaphelenchus okinawaensis]|uniref:Uncharacterized protein n=1 Tax=Bursaphelenchus okinawaensis TaxID=465554 RepID=A0A811LD14_9BILA|nr:unnamed protein product [Bursaphelenchus okinawaensis]CAG9120471.1 unnamed protein product [Bursaphelenchus okinawaensis]